MPAHPLVRSSAPPGRPSAGPSGRRGATAVALGLVALLATGACGAAQASGGTDPADGAALAADADLPTEVPEGTVLRIGDPTTQKAFELAGDDLDSDFSFEVEWANISGGPATTEAFRAGSLDVGAVAEIPPIHATWTGLDVQIYASIYRENWEDAPIYEFAGAPGVELDSLEDFRGHRIAFSPGQAQGAIVLKALQEAGLTQDDVELVELPSTGDVYSTALAAGEVDIAPLGGTQLFRYLATYEADGATSVKHHLRDDASHLYGPTEVVEDPAKAAALREYVAAWAAAKVWIDEHPEEWKQGYYVEDQGLSEEDAQYLIDHAPVPDIPSDLTEGIERTQATIDLLATELDQEPFDATDLFDERFGPVAGEAAAAARDGGAQ
ncbi:ABC transporter substrate-binding protein [Cellulosimicrobium cellulans]|uniref:ABC transporter substrate-binding protein n=1 Tax=Cellulosimicrobium cellulans TaxID=1710 RepID=UPI002097D1AC|nr:ABC transporter substrate-binding protein [Cellulosimicrobium cellulans]MCO7275520.1 ABC transporter substrate-binding protein [Cellulosimicrobium cellulans]